MGRQMGLEELSNIDIRFKQKFRYTFRVEEICGGQTIPEYFVKLAARPSWTTDEVEINYLNGKTWIPGKVTFDTLAVTYFDVATDKAKPLWDWLASLYDFTDPVNLHMGSNRRAYAARAVLSLWDGCGGELERWTLGNLWVQSINFQDLDNSAPDECNIEVTMRYDRIKYEPICPKFSIDPCCYECA